MTYPEVQNLIQKHLPREIEVTLDQRWGDENIIELGKYKLYPEIKGVTDSIRAAAGHPDSHVMGFTIEIVDFDLEDSEGEIEPLDQQSCDFIKVSLEQVCYTLQTVEI